MYKHLVTQYNYKTKQHTVIGSSTNAADLLFNTALNFIQNADGFNRVKDEASIRKLILAVDKRNATTPGHYIIRDQQADHVDKIEIWKKDIKYTSYYVTKTKQEVWTHVLDFDIVKIPSAILTELVPAHVKSDISIDDIKCARDLCDNFTNEISDILLTIRNTVDEGKPVLVSEIGKNEGWFGKYVVDPVAKDMALSTIMESSANGGKIVYKI